MYVLDHYARSTQGLLYRATAPIQGWPRSGRTRLHASSRTEDWRGLRHRRESPPMSHLATKYLVRRASCCMRALGLATADAPRHHVRTPRVNRAPCWSRASSPSHSDHGHRRCRRPRKCLRAKGTAVCNRHSGDEGPNQDNRQKHKGPKPGEAGEDGGQHKGRRERPRWLNRR